MKIQSDQLEQSANRRTMGQGQNGRYLSAQLLQDQIRVRGAGQHNLKNLDLELPYMDVSILCGCNSY